VGKRSNFERRPMDDYPTIDKRAGAKLAPFLSGVRTFAEPCCGDLALVKMLEAHGLVCVYYSDLKRGHDALEMAGTDADAIITNPPWTRDILHPMIMHFQQIAPTWLLFDADWMHTKQAAPFMDSCSDIVSVGRLKWIPGSKMSGKDNCAWYRFEVSHKGGPHFHCQRA
jgi:hypothetical protein